MAGVDPLVTRLTAGTPPRTWSVLVTVFGDLAPAPGQEIGSPVLGRLGEGIGLSREAVRTALHRLHREGWLTRRRVGRHSIYGLSDRGRAESEAARPRIYGPAAAARAFVVLTPEAGPGLLVAPSIRVASRPAEGSGALSFPLDAPPAWMRAALLPPETAALAAQVRARLDALDEALDADLPRDPMRVAVVRVVAVHLWRRVALRLPDLPDEVLPNGEDISAARRGFATTLARLPAPDPDTLAQASG